jgi:hypothetical protein
MPEKTYETSALLILRALADHPEGLALEQLGDRNPAIKLETLRSAACRLVTKGCAARVAPKTWRITEKGHRLLAGEGHLNNFRAPTKEEIEDQQRPTAAWVHPIRARALGLINGAPVASRSSATTASRSVASRSGLAGRRA